MTFNTCIIFLLALTILSVSAFAQLPTTCNSAPGAKPTDIVATTGALTYSVTSATWAAGTETLTIGANSLSIGNIVVVSGLATRGGVITSGGNGQVTLTGQTASTISYAVPVNPGTFAATTTAQVYYPGLTYLGTCINGVVYQVPIYGTAVNNAAVQPTMVGPSTTFGQVQPIICHAQYSFANDGGSHTAASGVVTPKNGCTIPAKSAVVGAVIYNSTQATSGGSATVSIGWSGLAAGLMTAATGTVANLSGSVFMTPVITSTYSTWQTVSAAQPITFTIGTADLTAGVIDVYVTYITMPGL
jgi:hypothetical protein